MQSLFDRLSRLWRRNKKPTTQRAYRCRCERPVFFRNSECLACHAQLGFARKVVAKLYLVHRVVQAAA